MSILSQPKGIGYMRPTHEFNPIKKHSIEHKEKYLDKRQEHLRAEAARSTRLLRALTDCYEEMGVAYPRLDKSERLNPEGKYIKEPTPIHKTAYAIDPTPVATPSAIVMERVKKWQREAIKHHHEDLEISIKDFRDYMEQIHDEINLLEKTRTQLDTDLSVLESRFGDPNYDYYHQSDEDRGSTLEEVNAGGTPFNQAMKILLDKWGGNFGWLAKYVNYNQPKQPK